MKIIENGGGAKCPRKLLVSFAVMSVVAVLASSACVVSDADVEASTETIDFDEFMNRLIAANYDYDGEGVTVDWKPVSGCWAGGPDGVHAKPEDNLPHIAGVGAANWNTPKKVDDGRYQYQICSGQTDVKISNVSFKFTTDDVKICANAKKPWYGEYSASEVKGAEIQLLNTGSLVLTNCSFDNVGLSPFNALGSITVADCQFKNVWDNYALKYLKGQSIDISGCEFNNIGCPILIWNCGGGSSIQAINIVDNNFVDIDVAATGGNFTHGLVKLEGATGTSYSGAEFKIRGNILSFTGDCKDSFGVIRVCKDAPAGDIVKEVILQNNFSVFPFIDFEKNTSTIYIDPTNGSDSNDGTSNSVAVKTLDKAISLASGKQFVNLFFVGGGEISNSTSITQIVSMDLNGYKVTLTDASIGSGGYLAVSSGVLYVDDSDLSNQILGTTMKTPSSSTSKVEVESDTAKTVAEKTGSTVSIVSEVTVTEDTDASQAIVEAVKQISVVKTAAETTETQSVSVQVVVPVTESTQKLEVSNAAVTALKDAGAELKVTNNDTTVSLDNDVLKTMSSSTGALSIIVTPEPESLTASQKSVIGSSQVLDVSAFIGTEKVSNLGGVATISVPYTAGGSVKVTYVADDGTTEDIPCTYSGGTVTFTTTHFSTYMLSSSAIFVPDDEDDYYPPYIPVQKTDSDDSDETAKVAILIGAIAVVFGAIMAIGFKSR